jgi:hypothetical protein
VKEALFVQPKAYYLKLLDGSEKKRFKGIPTEAITFDDYKKLYNGFNIEIKMDK